MKKRITALLITIAMLSGMLPAAPKVSAVPHSSMTSLQLQRLIENGDIPLTVRSLNLRSNRITDLSPLTALTELQTLNLGFNRVDDLSPLSELPNLRILFLDNNQITELSPLAGLADLVHLDLRNNQVRDVSPLSELPRLNMLNLRNNRVGNIVSLSALWVDDALGYSIRSGDLLLENNPICTAQIDALQQQIPSFDILHNATPCAGNCVACPVCGVVCNFGCVESCGICGLVCNIDCAPCNVCDTECNAFCVLCSVCGVCNIDCVLCMRCLAVCDSQCRHFLRCQRCTLSRVCFSWGDVNGDGEIDVADAIEIIRMTMGLSHSIGYGGRSWCAAMITGYDARPTVWDALEILKYTAGESSLINDETVRTSTRNVSDRNLETMLERGIIPQDITVLYLRSDTLSRRIEGMPITDLSPLSELTSLEVLNLDIQRVTDLSPLRYLTNLRVLSLNDNLVTDLSPLSYLTNLEVLNLNNNRVSDLSPLSSLTNLQRLYLGSNRIMDIGSLRPLMDSNLQYVGLRNNQIYDISALDGLTNIGWLDLSDNRISDITPLHTLEQPDEVEIFPGVNLQYGTLWLSNNRLRMSQISELLQATGQESEPWLRVHHNAAPCDGNCVQCAICGSGCDTSCLCTLCGVCSINCRPCNVCRVDCNIFCIPCAICRTCNADCRPCGVCEIFCDSQCVRCPVCTNCDVACEVCEVCGAVCDADCNCEAVVRCNICWEPDRRNCTICPGCDRCVRGCICLIFCERCGEEWDGWRCPCPIFCERCGVRDERDCNSWGDVTGIGRPHIVGALEILRYLVGLDSMIVHFERSWCASLILPESIERGSPGIGDALQILRYLVGLDGVLSQMRGW